MKKIITSVIAMSFLVGTSVSMADSEERQVNVRMSPAVLAAMLHVRVDLKIKNDVSIGPLLDYSMWHMKHHAFGLTANIKLDGGDIFETDGLYLNPYVSYGFGRFDTKKDSHGNLLGKVHNKTAGLILGHQWFFDSGFNCKLGIGVQYNSAEIFGQHFLPDIGMTIGYAF